MKTLATFALAAALGLVSIHDISAQTRSGRASGVRTATARGSASGESAGRISNVRGADRGRATIGVTDRTGRIGTAVPRTDVRNVIRGRGTDPRTTGRIATPRQTIIRPPADRGTERGIGRGSGVSREIVARDGIARRGDSDPRDRIGRRDIDDVRERIGSGRVSGAGIGGRDGIGSGRGSGEGIGSRDRIGSGRSSGAGIGRGGPRVWRADDPFGFRGRRDPWGWYRGYPGWGTAYARRYLSPWPSHWIRSCSLGFAVGYHGLACFRAFAAPVFWVPLIFVYHSPVLHVRTSTTYVERTVYDESDPRCAVVTVLLPGEDGYWKTMQLPVDGARTRDELRRLIGDRVRDGFAFELRDAYGATIEVPAGAQLDSVLVESCR